MTGLASKASPPTNAHRSSPDSVSIACTVLVSLAPMTSVSSATAGRDESALSVSNCHATGGGPSAPGRNTSAHAAAAPAAATTTAAATAKSRLPCFRRGWGAPTRAATSDVSAPPPRPVLLPVPVDHGPIRGLSTQPHRGPSTQPRPAVVGTDWGLAAGRARRGNGGDRRI